MKKAPDHSVRGLLLVLVERSSADGGPLKTATDAVRYSVSTVSAAWVFMVLAFAVAFGFNSLVLAMIVSVVISALTR
ncbi:hypothetical protein [Brevibacterium ravenspurgense]|uniref:hypothetical protein n=1 Tax=Brevibacterium ravenspurgense TaxID=479117 RepID=UPI000780287F|nr:hypothetical protein [Brevibacterium ravenspurgense]